ncbi:pilus assembly protein TadG-related protein [Streptomyces sp. I05A-00742]|uniref:pilus assembly protein TadG-related protein n=1 Tax=Streptomyces sp. I05A-00742 TaxID=2732853 RepID=UPI00289C5186|nr:pilus assembly protein TadG-related protein [Streptomyces sp. I05A-00742]
MIPERPRLPHRNGGRHDAGQAFPLYVVAVAGLLFVAFAVFAVGMAGAARNGTRSAADAAALAAAQSYRDQAYTGFLRDLTGRTGPPAGDWRRWLDGLGDAPATACREAERLARDNGAEPSGPGCAAAPGPDPASLAFDVTVVSRDAVGGSVVPGTENTHPTARSRAVVAPRCRPAADGGDQGPYARLDCDDGPWTVDPAHPDPRLTARTLFAVRLVATD